MSPVVKYTLARIGLFVVIAVALLPFKLDILLTLMIALVVSMVLSFFLFRRWRDELTEHVDDRLRARRAEKQRLRQALSGEDPTDS